MKRILLIAFCLLCSGVLLAQSFTCDELSNDIVKLKEQNQSNNKKRADAILKAFPLSNDGNISFKYNLVPKDSIVDIDRAMTVTHNFLKQVFKNPNESIKDIDTIKHVFTCVFDYGDIASYNGIGVVTKIECPIDFKVEINKSDITVKVRARQYALRSANSFSGVKRELIGVFEAYPVVTDKDNKESYAMAFINANVYCLSTCNNYYSWMNSHFEESKDTEDW